MGRGSVGRGGPAKAKAKARAERATAWREKVRKAKVERRAEQVKKKVEHGWQRSKAEEAKKKKEEEERKKKEKALEERLDDLLRKMKQLEEENARLK